MVDFRRTLFDLKKGQTIKLSTKASRKCLQKAGLKASELGAIIYTGIYREQHLMEPAIASFIQKKIGANSTLNGNNGTFSFDLNNGGCGLISGMQIIDGFIQSGKIQHGMVATGDTEPFYKQSSNFHFSPAAASVILTTAENGSGFISFKTKTFTRHKNSFASNISWMPWKNTNKKRNVLSVLESKDYLDLCIQCAMQTIKEFLAENKMDITEIDLILPSQSPNNFVARIREELHIEDKIIEVEKNGGDLHTSGAAAALKQTWDNGFFAHAKNILFLTVGSGITVAMALYKNE